MAAPTSAPPARAALSGTQRFLVPATLFIAGLLLGGVAGYRLAPRRAAPEYTDVQIRRAGGRLTNPLLECEVSHPPLGKELRPFKGRIEEAVRRIEKEGAVEKVAVYFRDLDNGPWFGIREQERFSPGSLYKVPVLMSVLRQAEVEPAFFSRELRFEGLPDARLAMTHFTPSERIEPGRAYTVQELVRRAAVYSDNGAVWLLERSVRPELFTETLYDLGLDPAGRAAGGRTFSAETYGRFFRILYNTTILSQAMSEHALALLAEADFREGLVAGVPPGVTVAHKFGERGVDGPDGAPDLQLHDCGIVYHPARHYLLCVMTEGRDYGAMARAIAAVSREVYGQISLQVSVPRQSQPFR